LDKWAKRYSGAGHYALDTVSNVVKSYTEFRTRICEGLPGGEGVKPQQVLIFSTHDLDDLGMVVLKIK
jgi:hypothetical protein